MVDDLRSRPVFRQVPADMFAFTTTDRAELHTAVMQVFGDAHERLVAALTFDEVLAALPGVGWYEPVADSSLDYTLGALHKYGLDRAHAEPHRPLRLGRGVRAAQPALLAQPQG